MVRTPTSLSVLPTRTLVETSMLVSPSELVGVASPKTGPWPEAKAASEKIRQIRNRRIADLISFSLTQKGEVSRHTCAGIDEKRRSRCEEARERRVEIQRSGDGGRRRATMQP